MRAVFAPGGTPLTAGAQLRQPALAATLSVLAERGAGALYRGPLAEAFGDGLAELGSAITRADLVAFAPVEEPPLRAQLSSFELLTAGPNSAGVLLAQALLALEAAGLEAPLGADARATAAIFDVLEVAVAILALRSRRSVRPRDPGWNPGACRQHRSRPRMRRD